MADGDHIKTCTGCNVKVNIRDFDNDSFEAWQARHRAATMCTGSLK